MIRNDLILGLAGGVYTLVRISLKLVLCEGKCCVSFKGVSILFELQFPFSIFGFSFVSQVCGFCFPPPPPPQKPLSLARYGAAAAGGIGVLYLTCLYESTLIA